MGFHFEILLLIVLLCILILVSKKREQLTGQIFVASYLSYDSIPVPPTYVIKQYPTYESGLIEYTNACSTTNTLGTLGSTIPPCTTGSNTGSIFSTDINIVAFSKTQVAKVYYIIVEFNITTPKIQPLNWVDKNVGFSEEDRDIFAQIINYSGQTPGDIKSIQHSDIIANQGACLDYYVTSITQYSVFLNNFNNNIFVHPVMYGSLIEEFPINLKNQPPFATSYSPLYQYVKNNNI